jgi:hypothetical protein
LDQGRPIDLNLAPEAVHMHLNDIRKWVIVFIPNMLCNLCAAYDLTGVAREVFQ